MTAEKEREIAALKAQLAGQGGSAEPKQKKGCF